MLIPLPLPFIRIELDGGKTAALTTLRGARVRVVEGRVWATTSGSPEDVWLGAGEEHRVPKQGLTVLEAADRRATVELTSPAHPGRSAFQRAVCSIAAAVLTALTLAVFVILPAQMNAGGSETQNLAAATADDGTP